MNQPLNDRDKKNIIERTKKLQKNEHIQLLKIIRDNNINYTENKNGCLIDLSKVPDDVILKLKDIIDICYQRREDEYKRNLIYEEMKQSVESLYKKKEQAKESKKIRRPPKIINPPSNDIESFDDIEHADNNFNDDDDDEIEIY